MSLFSCFDCKYVSVLYRVSKSVDMRERGRALGVCKFYPIVNKRVELFYKTLLKQTYESDKRNVVESSMEMLEVLGSDWLTLFWMLQLSFLTKT